MEKKIFTLSVLAEDDIYGTVHLFHRKEGALSFVEERIRKEFKEYFGENLTGEEKALLYDHIKVMRTSMTENGCWRDRRSDSFYELRERGFEDPEEAQA